MIVAGVATATGFVVTANAFEVVPAATRTLAGTTAAFVLELVRANVAPPAGAGALSVTVPVEDAPPVTLSGPRESCVVMTVTVTVTTLLDEQPFASVTISEYVVVVAGEAIGEQLAALERPVAGDQAQLTPPQP